jgi:hypothetical protein
MSLTLEKFKSPKIESRARLRSIKTVLDYVVFSNITDVYNSHNFAVSLNQRKTYFLFKINESQGKKNLQKVSILSFINYVNENKKTYAMVTLCALQVIWLVLTWFDTVSR